MTSTTQVHVDQLIEQLVLADTLLVGRAAMMEPQELPDGMVAWFALLMTLSGNRLQFRRRRWLDGMTARVCEPGDPGYRHCVTSGSNSGISAGRLG